MSSRSLLFVAVLLAAIGVGLYVRGLTSHSSRRSDAPTEAAGSLEAQAAHLAAAEARTRTEIRSSLEQLLPDKVTDRELTSASYDRLADAVLAIRAANRVLKGIPYSPETAALRAREIASLRAAIADFHAATGLAPSSLGELLGDTAESGETPR